MKNIIFATILIFVFASCNPSRDEYDYNSGIITIPAKVINPRPTIPLGDSVEFNFEVPDTIELNGVKKSVFIGTKDDTNFGINPCKIIQSRSGGFSSAPSLNTCNTYVAVGNFTINQVLNFTNVGGKLKCKFFMIPQQKGVYFFWQAERGYATLNNKSIKARVNLNFGNINRNHQMLIDSAGAANNFNSIIQGLDGKELYGFRVN